VLRSVETIAHRPVLWLAFRRFALLSEHREFEGACISETGVRPFIELEPTDHPLAVSSDSDEEFRA
jgi:hypothetical protein